MKLVIIMTTEIIKGRSDIRKIKRHNRLIEAHYDLTLTEQKIIYFAIANANLSHAIEPIEISRQELADFCQIKDTNLTQTFKEVVSRLQEKCLFLHEVNSDSWIKWNWTSMTAYKDGKFYIQLNKDLEPYITELKREFLNMNIKELMEFKSSYTMRVYELCLQRLKLGHVSFTLDDFRACVGANSASYRKIALLKAKVIEPAIQEINKKTAYEISVAYHKNGRKTQQIEFFIKLKPKGKEKTAEIRVKRTAAIPYVVPAIHPKLSNIVELVQKLFQKEDVREYFHWGAEYVLKNYQYTAMSNPKDFKRYFLSALRKNYAGAVSRMVQPDCPICHGYGIQQTHPEGLEEETVYLPCQCSNKKD